MSDLKIPLGLKRTAAMVVLRYQRSFLLLKRIKEPHIGKYVPVGGKLDPFEDPYSAALRETYEETGIAVQQLKYGGQSNQAFDKALQLNAKAPELLGTYAVCLVDREADLAKAEEMVENAVDILPNSPETTYAKGWILYKKKDFAKAKTWLEQSLQLGGSELPKVLEAYGDLLFQTESAESAIEYWTKALNKGSYSKLLKKKIADRKLYE